MNRFSFLHAASFITAIAAFATLGPLRIACAQSSTRGNAAPPTRQAAPSGSGTTSGAAELRVGLQGYCPVCIVNLKKWVKGTQRFTADYDGVRYYFPGEEQKQAFLEAPAKYSPVLAGDDIVVYTQTSKRVKGSLSHAVLHDGRLYLFANADSKRRFQSQPATFANADVALNGECPVCRVDMRQRVAGKPEFAAKHNGLRYFFPADPQKQTFLENPAAYVEAATRGMTGAPAGSGTQPATSTGSGTR